MLTQKQPKELEECWIIKNKNMKVVILVFSLLFAIQTTCSSQMHPDEREIRAYKEVIGLYPPGLVLGFPKKIDKKMSVLVGYRSPRGEYQNYIHLAVFLDKKEIESLKTKLAAKSKTINHLTDSCLMIIPYNYAFFKVIKSDSLKNCKSSHMLPIPNFKYFGMGFPPEFYKDATIYVLDAKQGRFLEDDNLSISGVGLPKEWLHGYTKGVTIFKNYAIYWLEVW